MGQLDILSYGISMTNLEEVFLEVNGRLNGSRGSKQVEYSSL